MVETKKKKSKKEEDVQELPKKERFTVKIEIMAPVSLAYTVEAENDEEALQLVLSRPDHCRLTSAPKINLHNNLNSCRKIKAAVHKSNSGIITLTKKF